MSAWYIVTGRLEHDDEDSLYILEADSWQEAAREAEAERRAEADEPPHDEEADDGEATGRPWYTNYVVACPGGRPATVLVNV